MSAHNEGPFFPFKNKPEEDELTEIVHDALSWCSLHGLIIGDRLIDNSGAIPGVGIGHAPISLFPTPYPPNLFQHAIKLAPLFNELAYNVSRDAEFLQNTLSSAGRADDFTLSLLKLHDQIQSDGPSQEIELAILRSDYMVDVSTNSLLQIELNTMSSALAGVSSLVSSLHSYIVKKNSSQLSLKDEGVIHNDAANNLAHALYLAWKEFDNPDSYVLMVVQDTERNMYDQYCLSAILWEKYGVRVIRKTLTQIYHQAKISLDKKLIIGNDIIVSVAYFRSGYRPEDYPSNFEWESRLMIEKSSAIKCPTIAYQLMGTKKVQQELATDGVLERFIKDPEAVSAIRSCFAGLWSLEGKEGKAIMEEAMANPHRFVLKPQREGGGNNVYGEDIAKMLRKYESNKHGGDEESLLSAYILMQRIFPNIQFSYLVRNGSCDHSETISELGIFSTYIRNGDKVVMNEAAGHLLRTKMVSSDEGGVASGYSVLDSPYLQPRQS